MNSFLNKVRATAHVGTKPIVTATSNTRAKIAVTAVALEARDLSEDLNEVAARLVVLSERSNVDPIDVLATALVAHADAKVKAADQAKKDADAAQVKAIQNLLDSPAVQNANPTPSS